MKMAGSATETQAEAAPQIPMSGISSLKKAREYQEADVEPIRTQFHTPAWSRIAGVRRLTSRENSEVFLKTATGKIRGLAIHFHIPKVDMRKESGCGNVVRDREYLPVWLSGNRRLRGLSAVSNASRD